MSLIIQNSKLWLAPASSQATRANIFAYSKPVIATGSSNKVVFPPLLSLFLSAIIPNSFSFACSDVRILEVAGSRAPGPCFYETSLLTTRPPPTQQFWYLNGLNRYVSRKARSICYKGPHIVLISPVTQEGNLNISIDSQCEYGNLGET